MTKEDLVSKVTPETKHLFLDLRAKIFEQLPEAIKEIDLKANLAGYMITLGYKGTVFTLLLAKNWVTMGFSHGAELSDPEGLLTGSSKVHKIIKFTTADHIQNPAFYRLMAEAIKAANSRLKTAGEYNV